MTQRPVERQQDPWTQYFAAATAESESERQRLHVAALAALLLHGLFFVLRLPEGRPLLAPPAPLRAPIRLVDFDFRPRTVEPQPVAPEVAPAEPTLIVPGPPEVDIVPIEATTPAEIDPVLPLVEPLDFLPVEAPPAPPAPSPVRYDASIERPQRLFAPLPAYTPTARRVRREGSMIIEAIIDEHGAVVDARVLKGLGFGLDESALETIGTWRFEPARRNGRALAVIYSLVIHFEIE